MTTKTVDFRTLDTSVTGEFADNMTYPEKVRVTIPLRMWESVLSMLAGLHEAILSVDMRIMNTQDVFLDADGLEVELEDCEDNPQFQCYRFVRHSVERFTFHLVLAAKYHDTFVEYELAPVQEVA